MNLSEFSIYTIVHVDELNRIHEAGGVGTFTENKGPIDFGNDTRLQSVAIINNVYPGQMWTAS